MQKPTPIGEFVIILPFLLPGKNENVRIYQFQFFEFFFLEISIFAGLYLVMKVIQMY